MKINFKTIERVADLYVDLSSRLEVKRFYLTEEPKPMLMVIHARTVWGILAIASHWFRRLNALNSAMSWAESRRISSRYGESILKNANHELLFSAKGVEVYAISPIFQYDDEGNEELIPLSNFTMF